MTAVRAACPSRAHRRALRTFCARARWREAVACLALGGAMAMLPSCTQVSDRVRFGVPEAPLRVAATFPAAGAMDVRPEGTLQVCLSALVDPRSLAADDAQLRSGAARFDTKLSLQLLPTTDRDGGAVPPQTEAPWCEGSVLSVQSQTRLTPGAQYRLLVQPALRGWSGEALDTTQPGWVSLPDGGPPQFSLEFVVDPNADAMPPDDEPMPEPAPTLTALFASGGPLDPQRANCSCHSDPDALAWRRLNLSSPAAAYDGLVRPHGIRDTGFAMVAPRNPSESFLLHKLLRDHEGEPLLGVLGDAMPPGEPLPYADLVAISRWIEAGAALE